MLVGKQYCQMAWVVEDLDLAVRQWRETALIGPFFVGEHVGGMITELRYRGQAAEVDISCALAQAGAVQIELITQHGSAPSPYRDTYAEGEEGIHHICSFVEDVEAERANYEKHGFAVAMSGLIGGETPFYYMDTRSAFGCMTEMIEHHGPPVDLFAAVAAAAVDWDGADPVRDMATMMEQ